MKKKERKEVLLRDVNEADRHLGFRNDLVE